MAYTKEEMLYYDYYWGLVYEVNDPHISGDFDDTVLRRTAGREMLYFVNRCGDIWRWGGQLTKGFRKLERIIRDMVPQKIKTQKDVKQWIDDHLDSVWEKMEMQEAE